MAYDEELAEQVRRQLIDRGVAFDEKRMMGGLCFMVDDKMCLGVETERLMVRLNPVDYAAMLERPGAEPMDFTGRPMKGYVWVYEEGRRQPAELGFWIDLALEFNPHAKSSKKRNPRSLA